MKVVSRILRGFLAVAFLVPVLAAEHVEVEAMRQVMKEELQAYRRRVAAPVEADARLALLRPRVEKAQADLSKLALGMRHQNLGTGRELSRQEREQQLLRANPLLSELEQELKEADERLELLRKKHRSIQEKFSEAYSIVRKLETQKERDEAATALSRTELGEQFHRGRYGIVDAIAEREWIATELKISQRILLIHLELQNIYPRMGIWGSGDIFQIPSKFIGVNACNLTQAAGCGSWSAWRDL